MSDLDPLDGALRRLSEHAQAAADLPPSAQIRARANRRRQRRHTAVAGLGAIALLAGVGAIYTLQPRDGGDDRLVTMTNQRPDPTTLASATGTPGGPEAATGPSATNASVAPGHTSNGTGSPSAGSGTPLATSTLTAPGSVPTDTSTEPADPRAREVTRVNLVGWSSRGADETYLWVLVGDACGPLGNLADQARGVGGPAGAVVRDGCLRLGDHPVYLKLKLSPRGLLVVTATERSVLSPDNPQTLPLTGFLTALTNLKVLDATQVQPKVGAPSIPADITTDAQNVIVAITELPSSGAAGAALSATTTTTP